MKKWHVFSPDSNLLFSVFDDEITANGTNAEDWKKDHETIGNSVFCQELPDEPETIVPEIIVIDQNPEEVWEDRELTDSEVDQLRDGENVPDDEEEESPFVDAADLTDPEEIDDSEEDVKE